MSRLTPWSTNGRAVRRLPLVLALVLVTSAGLGHAQAADAEQEWRRLVALRRATDGTIKSVSVTYTFRLDWDYAWAPREQRSPLAKDKATDSVSKEVEYGRSGRKFHARDHFSGAGSPFVHSDYRVTYDGSYYRHRPGTAKMLVMSTSADRFKLGTPPPSSLVERDTPAEIDARLAAGAAKLVDVQRVEAAGRPCLRATFTNADGARAEFDYDVEHGYLLIGERQYAADGTVAVEVKGVTLAAVVSAGNTLYYPVAGELCAYQPGGQKVMERHSFKVPDGGLRINEPIDESKFTMSPEPGEWVWDADTRMSLIDPGKQLDVLDEALGFQAREAAVAVQRSAGAPSTSVDVSVVTPAAPVAAEGPPVARWRIAGLAVAAVLAVVAGLVMRGARQRGADNK